MYIRKILPSNRKRIHALRFIVFVELLIASGCRATLPLRSFGLGVVRPAIQLVRIPRAWMDVRELSRHSFCLILTGLGVAPVLASVADPSTSQCPAHAPILQIWLDIYFERTARGVFDSDAISECAFCRPTT